MTMRAGGVVTLMNEGTEAALDVLPEEGLGGNAARLGVIAEDASSSSPSLAVAPVAPLDDDDTSISIGVEAIATPVGIDEITAALGAHQAATAGPDRPA